MTELTLKLDDAFFDWGCLGMKDWFAGERGAYFLWLGIALIALFGVLEYRFPGRSNWRRRAGV
jgi:hypothetical protein